MQGQDFLPGACELKTLAMTEISREPHSVSLKVLRLSRPSLNQNFPLAIPSTDSDLNPKAGLDILEGESDDQYILGPLLTLPPTFGTAYVGETFSTTVCINNELRPEADRQLSSIRIGAEMRAPSGTIPLDVMPKDVSSHDQIKPGASLQKIVKFDLREEGPHTLAVNVNYSETTISKDNSASGGRSRSFSKLYQFAARPCLTVRTKISAFPHDDPLDIKQLALEAQLDNVGDVVVTLNSVNFTPKPAFNAISLNWDVVQEGPNEERSCPVLAPRDVMQVAFLVELKESGPARELTRDGRIVLGQLSIQWKTAMGDTGFLSTGWLTTKRR